ERGGMVEDGRRICELAEKEGIRIAVEFHGKTLTDTNESAKRFVEEVGHGNLGMLWQPTPGMSLVERMEGLKGVLPVLANLHVYHYAGEEYRALEGMEEEWRGYLEVVRGTGRDHCCLMEFVEGDSVEAFLRDAVVLKRMLKGVK
ncbi:MAG TPA: hypothetical protein VFE58_08055, partial [Tepidisphaeraceae bacterium]|nr:hypothetical protein [Tepidisphaeraceae bacterium]